MCIAAVINKPVSLEYLEFMDTDNPHGGGVAWFDATKGQIAFHRNIHAKEIHELQESGVLTYPYLLHFRWATHGSIGARNAHPFPTGIRALMGESSGHAPQVIIHNGIWHEHSGWLKILENEIPVSLLDDASDTAIAALLYEVFPDIGDEIAWAVAGATVVNGAMEIRKHGDVWQSHEDNAYSNLTWLPWSIRYPNRSKGSKAWTYGSGWEDGYSGHSWGARSEASEVTRHMGKEESWEDYITRRYGRETLDEVKRLDEADIALAAGADTTELNDDIPELSQEDCDLISDDPAVVQAWIERQCEIDAVKTFMKSERKKEAV